MSHLVRILSKSEETVPSTPEGRLLQRQLSLSILKAMQHLITQEGSNYLTTLQTNEHLDAFVNHLYELQSSQSKGKDIVPVEWLEVKCAQIKKRAMENDLSILPGSSESFATVINKKQIVVALTDARTQEKIVKNAQLISAINLHEVVDGKEYRCGNAADMLVFSEKPPRKDGILDKRHGLIFIEGSHLTKLDNKALNVLLTSQIVVTTTDVQPKELFSKLYQLVMKDNDKEEKERSLNGLLESVILFVRKADFERVQMPAELVMQPFYKTASSPLEGLVQEFKAWANIDQDLLLYHLSDYKDEGFNVLSMKIIKVLKDLQEEKQKNKDKLKKLEVDKKLRDLEALKKKIEEADAKRAKDVEEKLLKLKESGFSLSASANSKPVSTTDKVAKEDVETLSKGLIEKPLVNILHVDEKTEKKIEQIIENKFTTYREDAPSDDVSKKSEEALRKEFF